MTEEELLIELRKYFCLTDSQKSKCLFWKALRALAKEYNYSLRRYNLSEVGRAKLCNSELVQRTKALLTKPPDSRKSADESGFSPRGDTSVIPPEYRKKQELRKGCSVGSVLDNGDTVLAVALRGYKLKSPTGEIYHVRVE
jgi:hypothetical protein